MSVSNMKNEGMKSTEKLSPYSAPALSRGLRILEFLSSSAMSKTTQEIATELGRNRNEVFRMIAVLEIEDYLCKGADGIGYILSGKLLELGLTTPKISDILEAITPLATELTLNTGAPCHLALPSRDEMIVLKRWEPKFGLSINVPVATRRSLEITASGIVMLCSMSPAELALTISSIQERYSNFSVQDLEPYQSELKRNGVLQFNSKLMDGVVDLSVLLISQGGQLHGALTVPYANNTTCDTSIEEISNMLKSVSQRISKMLIRP
jgi:DNA-binding IclR family transcriptional regulator